MVEWTPSRRDQKQYPHFDAPLSLKEMKRIANDPVLVATNKFHPFLKYDRKFRPFRPSGGDVKPREIRYASRRDAAIFSRYRVLLSELYEKELRRLGIGESVLAYRRIPVGNGSSSGKCNIHHAKEAFDQITNIGNCCAIVMDVSKYFEHLDHDKIKRLWCRLIGLPKLPDDHYQVFKNITQYRVVDARAAYETLGFFGTKPSGIPGFLVPKEDMPKQLCSPEEFRAKICGDASGYKSLIEPNGKPYGIPQGAPLSDLLANLYLIDFDVEMSDLSSSMGGCYMRYSDDILMIVPGGPKNALDLMDHVRARIKTFGKSLQIKIEKCSVHKFERKPAQLVCSCVFPYGKKSNGLSYLGFRFDGNRVYLRDGTLANLWRRVSLMLKREAIGLVKRYPGKDLSFLESEFDLERFIQRVGRVRGFEESLDKKDWTFWTYARRSHYVFGKRSHIHSQLSRHREIIRRKAQTRLSKTYHKSLGST